MKKENKKIAQQKRAEERKKEAQKNLLKKIGIICIPVIALMILFAIGIGFFNSTDSAESTTSSDEVTEVSQTTTTESTEAEPADYLTDQDLTVKDGDTVNIDYIGYVDGVEFEGGNTNGTGTNLTIGSGSYIDDFEEQLIGYHPGDTVEVRVTFPDTYHEASLAGKEALFVTTINGIYE